MKKLILLSFLILLSCNKDDITEPELTGWQGQFNSSGYPNVIGEYSFVTKEFTGNCSDGSGGKSPAISFNLIINQEKNQLTFSQKNPQPSVGMTVLESTALDGTIDKEGKFVANQYTVVTMTGIVGNVNLHYNITGSFKPNSWTGDYKYTATFLSYNGSCTYTTSFTGDKISSSQKIEKFKKENVIFPIIF